MNRVAAFVLAVAAVICGPIDRATAQSWPDHTVKFIVPFGPGAGADIGARLFAERLSARWGKPVVVENRPGGDGFVAITAFVGANDDHTLLFAAAGSFTAHPYQHDKVPYDIRDIVPIARVSNTIITVAVPESMKLENLASLVALAREKPGKLNAALVPGITEFVWDGFVNQAKLDFAKVPYRDIVQAGTDLGENRIQVMMTGLAVIQAQVQGNRVRLLAVTNRKRAVSYPDIPTVTEAGFPALELEGLVGLFGPRSMAAVLRERIAADVRAVAADPVVVDRLTTTAQVVNPGTPAEFAAAIDEQRAKMAAIAQRLGLKAAAQ